MGVPKFYRWISERYPCLSEVVKEYQIPEFDNLYLDMNGIVHVCSHPEDDNPHFRITEEKIFKDIFHYIEVLFRMIRPQKVFFMAIDGVAPRAKMNQQRGRRFRSAREAENLIKEAEEKGEVLPTEKRFDSNCITPGTPFMVRLQEQLKYFVVNKISTDPIWQGIRIYLSGHQTPGEGEHKVMDFIRSEKTMPDHDPNTRHCLYGLDADLIMLGLTSHEPHFSLLREEVRFGNKKDQKRSTTPEETTFHLLHLSLMREYLEFEFSPLKEKIGDRFDIEKIIDDWVLMGFLVGNDFIPHLPHMHIHTESLPQLWKTYIEIIPTLDGYLNEDGKINLQRFEKFMNALSQADLDAFSDQYADLKWLEGKTGSRKTKMEMTKEELKRFKRIEKKVEQMGGIPTANQFMDLVESDDQQVMEELDLQDLEATSSQGESTEDEEEEEEEDPDGLMLKEFRMHKDNYYRSKMEYVQVTKEVLREQAEGYIRALQWILYYYYRGCPSWSWYYEHHYAPYISDVKNFADMKMGFDMAKPFLPFEQLMAVLPSASKELLPELFQDLMENDSSPIIDYYPKDFETDLNGKLQEWEAVVLIPFINETRLLTAMKPLYPKMSADEKSRNAHGPHILFETSSEPQGTYKSVLAEGFPDIVNHRAQITELDINVFVIPHEKLVFGRPAACLLDVYFPGFPTLRHLPHTFELTQGGVKVFQQNSRHDNMMLKLEPKPMEETNNIEKLAQDLIGQGIYVGWPHMSEARVVSISNGDIRYYGSNQGKKQGNKGAKIQTEEDDRRDWASQVNHIKEFQYDRKGIIIGQTEILVKAQPMVGRKYICGTHGNITLEKQWSDLPQYYVYQATVKDITVKDPAFEQYKSIEDLFKNDSEVFMLGSPHYGAQGKVLEVGAKTDGRIRVEFNVFAEPSLEHVMQRERSLSTKYMPGHHLAQRIGISGFIVSRITGTFFITKGSKENPGKSDQRINVGLNLKFNKKNEEVVGYTKKNDDGWVYSQKTAEELDQYIEEFPALFDYISAHSKADNLYEQDVFENQEYGLSDVTKFLKTLPCSSAMRTATGSQSLDQMVVVEIEKEVDKVKGRDKKVIKMQVRPHLLYRPLDAQRTLIPDTTTSYELYDRVVNVRNGYSVPLGLRGTVVGIYPAAKPMETVYEVVFDEPFAGGMTIRSSPNRGYRMPPFSMVNLTHGYRKESNRMGNASGHKPTAVVKPQESTYSQMANKQYRSYDQRQDGYQDGYRQQNYHPRYDNRGNYGGNQGRSYDNNDRHYDNQDRRYDNNDRRYDDRSRGRHNQHGANNNSNYRGNDRDQRYNQNRTKPQKGEDDFAKFWQELEEGVKFDAPKDPSKNVQESNKAANNIPLSQAAKSLPNPNMFDPNWMQDSNKAANQSNQGSQNTSQSNGTLQDILFGMKTDSQPNQEVLVNKMKALDVSQVPQQTSAANFTDPAIVAMETNAKMSNEKDGTAALQDMLKIGQHKNEPKKSESSQQQQPQFNKQVSLQELLKGYQPPQGQQPAPTTQQQPHGQHPQQHHQHQNQQHQPRKQQQQKQQQGKQGGRRVNELKTFVQAMGIPAPQFNLNNTTNGGFVATVTLGNGQKFAGSHAPKQEQALESAASIALMNLQGGSQQGMPPFMMGGSPQQQPHRHGNQHQQQQQQQRFQGPRGNFSSSPNSAFTPVKPSGKQPFFDPRNNMPNMNFSSPPQHRPGGPQHPSLQGWMPQGSPGNQRGHFNPQNRQHGHHYGNQGGYYGNQGHHGNQGYHGNQYGNQGNQYGNQGQYGSNQGGHHGGGHHGNQNYQGHHGNDSRRGPSQEKQNPEGAEGEGTSPGTNPFIPLQVQRKQKTPQRDVRKRLENSYSDGNDVGAHQESGRHKNGADSKSQSADGSTRSKQQQGSQHRREHKKSTSESADGSTKKSAKPKRQRNRLAANFGGPPS